MAQSHTSGRTTAQGADHKGVSRNVISNREAKDFLQAMVDALRQGHGGDPSSAGVDFVAHLIKTSASTVHSSPEPLDG